MWHTEIRISEIPMPADGGPEGMNRRAEQLARAGGRTVYNAPAGTLTAWTDRNESDPVDAVAAARAQAVEALQAAGVTGARVEAVEAIGPAERERRLMRPDELEVVSSTEAAEILNVSQPRASALLSPNSARHDPEAPRPIVPRRGLYLREAVEVYALRRNADQTPWKRSG